MGDEEGRRLAVVFLEVGDEFALEMLPNPFTPRSTVSRPAMMDLERRGLIPPEHGNRFVLDRLRLAGQPVPSVEVSVGRAATLLRVDGILGFNFFGSFREICLDTRTMVMTLRLDP